MNHEQALLEHLLENPSDWSARLALADWFVERGDPRGELVRLPMILSSFVDYT
jgi:uncharacterized protein (TIGR02996 family)